MIDFRVGRLREQWAVRQDADVNGTAVIVYW